MAMLCRYVTGVGRYAYVLNYNEINLSFFFLCHIYWFQQNMFEMLLNSWLNNITTDVF